MHIFMDYGLLLAMQSLVRPAVYFWNMPKLRGLPIWSLLQALKRLDDDDREVIIRALLGYARGLHTIIAAGTGAPVLATGSA